MKFNWVIALNIISPIAAAALTIWLNRVLERRPKLVSYMINASQFKIKDDAGTQINTHSIVLRNAGKKPVTNIRVSHFILPDNFNIYPPVSHSTELLPDGGADIVIPKLVPGEQITISYLYFPPTTWDKINSQTKFDDGFAKIIKVLPMPQYPKWVNRLLGYLIIWGIIALVYVLIQLGIYLFDLYS